MFDNPIILNQHLKDLEKEAEFCKQQGFSLYRLANSPVAAVLAMIVIVGGIAGVMAI
ncbi:hypothetical protein [Marimonas lutisalis]|uniref:hypothetical protein n=1 Tax=Marimonas lutisalis TaxID=2545756 RepID=UPI001376118C|nr:hypothetical protein [Marimonas lutisalis]